MESERKYKPRKLSKNRERVESETLPRKFRSIDNDDFKSAAEKSETHDQKKINNFRIQDSLGNLKNIFNLHS